MFICGWRHSDIGARMCSLLLGSYLILLYGLPLLLDSFRKQWLQGYYCALQSVPELEICCGEELLLSDYMDLSFKLFIYISVESVLVFISCGSFDAHFLYLVRVNFHLIQHIANDLVCLSQLFSVPSINFSFHSSIPAHPRQHLPQITNIMQYYL